MKKVAFPNSIRTCIPLLMASIIVPLLALLVAYTIYSGWLLQNQAATLARNSISLFGNQVDPILGMIDKSLLNTDVEDAGPYSDSPRPKRAGAGPNAGAQHLRGDLGYLRIFRRGFHLLPRTGPVDLQYGKLR